MSLKYGIADLEISSFGSWTFWIKVITDSMITLKQSNQFFMLSCILGTFLSYCAFVVELKKEADEDYEAFCDINEYISCTKAFSSKYGKGFGVIGDLFGEQSILNQPNSVAGMLFYMVLLSMAIKNDKTILRIQTALCFVSNLMSIYLAYILYFILKDFCMICVGTYVVNAINMYLCILKWNILKQEDGSRKHKD